MSRQPQFMPEPEPEDNGSPLHMFIVGFGVLFMLAFVFRPGVPTKPSPAEQGVRGAATGIYKAVPKNIPGFSK
jgi:hypothetical protein